MQEAHLSAGSVLERHSCMLLHHVQPRLPGSPLLQQLAQLGRAGTLVMQLQTLHGQDLRPLLRQASLRGCLSDAWMMSKSGLTGVCQS